MPDTVCNGRGLVKPHPTHPLSSHTRDSEQHAFVLADKNSIKNRNKNLQILESVLEITRGSYDIAFSSFFFLPHDHCGPSC